MGYSPWDHRVKHNFVTEKSLRMEKMTAFATSPWENGDDPYRYSVGVKSALCRHWNEQGKEFMAQVCSLKSCEPKWGKCRSGSDGKESAFNARDLGLTPGKGRSSGKKNGHPLQFSCLGNAMDRGAWWASVHGVAKSQILLSDYHFH